MQIFIRFGVLLLISCLLPIENAIIESRLMTPFELFKFCLQMVQFVPFGDQIRMAYAQNQANPGDYFFNHLMKQKMEFEHKFSCSMAMLGKNLLTKAMATARVRHYFAKIEHMESKVEETVAFFHTYLNENCQEFGAPMYLFHAEEDSIVLDFSNTLKETMQIVDHFIFLCQQFNSLHHFAHHTDIDMYSAVRQTFFSDDFADALKILEVRFADFEGIVPGKLQELYKNVRQSQLSLDSVAEFGDEMNRLKVMLAQKIK